MSVSHRLSSLSTWSPVGGSDWEGPRCGLAGRNMSLGVSGGQALRFHSHLPPPIYTLLPGFHLRCDLSAVLAHNACCRHVPRSDSKRLFSLRNHILQAALGGVTGKHLIESCTGHASTRNPLAALSGHSNLSLPHLSLDPRELLWVLPILSRLFRCLSLKQPQPLGTSDPLGCCEQLSLGVLVGSPLDRGGGQLPVQNPPSRGTNQSKPSHCLCQAQTRLEDRGFLPAREGRNTLLFGERETEQISTFSNTN